MIHNKSDLCHYLEEDRIAFGKPELTLKTRIIQYLFTDYNWEFMRILRKLEYYQNKTVEPNSKIIKYFYKLKYFYYSYKDAQLRSQTGIELPPNCAGAGLHISHGKCVVSSIARIGEHCKILSDVTIGGQGRYDVPGAPTIGNRVFIASGAKILGSITIADDVVIGANAVVTKDILEPGTTWAGIPARKISDTGSNLYLRKEFRKK